MQGWVASYRRLAAILAAGTVFLSSLAGTAAPTERAGALAAVAGAFASVLFCIVDARFYDKSVPRGLILPLFMGWPVGIGVHLIWTRGKKGVLVYALAVVAYFALQLLGAGAGELLR